MGSWAGALVVPGWLSMPRSMPFSDLNHFQIGKLEVALEEPARHLTCYHLHKPPSNLVPSNSWCFARVRVSCRAPRRVPQVSSTSKSNPYRFKSMAENRLKKKDGPLLRVDRCSPPLLGRALHRVPLNLLEEVCVRFKVQWHSAKCVRGDMRVT